MRSLAKNSRKLIQRGFTLVELLIVVIILAILAAIVIPQFSSATVDAQEGALDANLNALRSAIDLYRVQHGNVYPGVNVSTGATCGAGGTAGGGAVLSSQALIEQLTMFSSVAGATCTNQGVATVTLGPYLRKGFPAEPVSNSTAIAIVSNGSPLAPANATTAGWVYNTTTGQILKNSNAADSKGTVLYSAH